MKKNANKGFSLVELIIVIAIMAVLIGVLAPQFIKHVENSRQSTDMDNVQSIKTAIEAAAADEAIDAATIKVGSKGGDITFTATKGESATAVTLEGVSSPCKVKSQGWKGGEYEYDFDSFTWKIKTSGCTNEKNTSKGNNIDTIFE